MPYPFEVTLEELTSNLDLYVDSVFTCLESEFLTMPKGNGFVDYPPWEDAYENLKFATNGFSHIDVQSVFPVVDSHPLSFIVLRTILGFTPPELAYVATQKTGITVTQSFARALDRNIRLNPTAPLTSKERVKAMVEAACKLLNTAIPAVGHDEIHRLDKADTRQGITSIQRMASIGMPYAMVLYERFLGRPFATHRDSVSDLVGDALELPIEDLLTKAGVSYRRMRRGERIEGFDQAPDFIIPSEFNPQIVIEAKITQDDGTARDKVTRVQHLAELSIKDGTGPKFQVIACISGRGFGVRREDIKKLLLATEGKVFTLKTLNMLISHSKIKQFAAYVQEA